MLNAGFETGDFTDWSQSGDLSFTGVTSSHCPGANPGTAETCTPNSGNSAAYFGPGAFGGITQNIVTIAGGVYDVDFWLNTEGNTGFGNTPNEYRVSWDGNVITDVVNAAAAGWTHYTFNGLVASGTSTPLAFSFQNSPNWFGLDDISVTDVVTGEAPEPGTVGLTAGALLFVVAGIRRKLS